MTRVCTCTEVTAYESSTYVSSAASTTDVAASETSKTKLEQTLLAGLPSPPLGFVYLLGADGVYLLGDDGAYLLGVA